MVEDYNGSGQSDSISVQQNDIINVKISSFLRDPFGMTFTTSTLAPNSNVLGTVSWYNYNLATEMLVQDFYFTSPLDEVTLYSGTQAPIYIISYPESKTLTVFLLNFNLEDPVVSYQAIQSNTEESHDFLIPADLPASPDTYQLWAEYGKQDSLNYIQFGVKETVPSVINFVSGVTGASYSAGTNAMMKITSSPEAGNFMIQLKCEALAAVTRVISSNTDDDQAFLIPNNFYGNTCVFSITYPIVAGNTPTIIDTQPVSFLEPSSYEYYIINRPIPVTLSAISTIPDNFITARQVCGSVATEYLDVAVNCNFYAMPPINYLGECIFSSFQSGLYEAAFPTVTITISGKIQLIFVKVPKNIFNGQVFTVRIDSIRVLSIESDSVDMELICDGRGLGSVFS